MHLRKGKFIVHILFGKAWIAQQAYNTSSRCMVATSARNPALHFLQPTTTHSNQNMVKPEQILAQLRDNAPSSPYTQRTTAKMTLHFLLFLCNQQPGDGWELPYCSTGLPACMPATIIILFCLFCLKCMRRCLKDYLQGGSTRAHSGDSAHRQPVHGPRSLPLLVADKSASGSFAALQPDAPGTCKVMC